MEQNNIKIDEGDSTAEARKEDLGTFFLGWYTTGPKDEICNYDITRIKKDSNTRVLMKFRDSKEVLRFAKYLVSEAKRLKKGIGELNIQGKD